MAEADSSGRRQPRRAWLRLPPDLVPAWLSGVLALLLVVALEQVIEGFALRSELARARVSGLEYLASVRSRLEGVINANLLLVHGLDAVIIAHPDIDQAEFSRIARGLVDERHALREVAAAPGMVISLIYPLEGNRGALGLDYRTHPTQRAAAMRAVDSRLPVVAGPLRLSQGGVGIVVREAVWLPGADAADTPRLWGLLSGVIDAEVLYRLAGLVPGDPAWRLAIRGVDGSGAAGGAFYGDGALFGGDAVSTEVRFPGGSWQLAAAPAGGWLRTSPAVVLIRLLGFTSALLVGLLVWRLGVGARSLASTQARMGSLIEALPDLVWMKDTSGRYLWCNRRFAAVAGLEERDVIGRRDSDLFEPGLAERFQGSDQLAKDSGAPVRIESSVPIPTRGATLLVETIKVPVQDERGRHLGVLGIGRDVSERHASEQRARMGDLVLDSVFQAIPDLFFLMDADGTIRDYRAQRGGDLYVPPQAFLGRRMQDVIPAAPAAQFAAAMDALASGAGLQTYGYDLALPGGVRHFEARLSQLAADGQVIAVVRDVTEQHQASVELELRVRERTAQIAAVNQQLETFAYLVSHDLKAPLRGIDGYSRLLLEDHAVALDDEARTFVTNIRSGVERMGELIEDLLAYSRAERRTFRGTRLQLEPALRAILAGWHEELAGSGAEVRVAVGALSVLADPDGVRMVFGNLIDNAVKFRRPDAPPTIDIRAEVREDRVIVTFTDQGIGFDMRFHERIFEIFQRLQRSEEYPGTGVGLAIVHKAMERMGGRVWAESAPGAGASFHLEFPA